jgi:hypothetical protein
MSVSKPNIKNNKDTINNLLNHIVKEKDKLDKLTKTVVSNKKSSHKSVNTKKLNTNLKNSKTHSLDKIYKNDKQVDMINNKELVKEIDDKELDDKEFDDLQLEKISPETSKKILELLKNYVKMDKSFRLKHESLKTLYNAYLALYNKYKDSSKEINQTKPKSDSNTSNTTNDKKDEILDNGEILKNIHSEMKDNNSNLYKERLIILKKIKETPDIEPEIKNKICGRLLVIFKAPPVSNYTQLPMLEQSPTLQTTTQTEEKINIKELDDAYLQKHNELMTVYKAYQNLFNVVLNYKDQLNKYKQLPTGSSISRSHMDKLIKDQGFVMDMIDKMQDQLVSKNIISNLEKVPVNPVTSHPENIGTFNNTMRDQIKHIIDRQVEVKPDMKMKIEDLLNQYKDCDSNDKFCQSGRQLLLLKKM